MRPKNKFFSGYVPTIFTIFNLYGDYHIYIFKRAVIEGKLLAEVRQNEVENLFMENKVSPSVPALS